MTASSSERLCTLADVKALAQKSGVNADSQDGLIESLIPRASIVATRYCDRQFAPVETAAEHIIELPWGEEIASLSPYDLQGQPEEVKLLADNPELEDVVLSASEYRVAPEPPRDGTYISLRLLLSTTVREPIGTPIWPNMRLAIKGTWGFPAIPPDVTHGVAAIIVHWLVAYTAAFRRPDDATNANAPVRGVPEEAEGFLCPYIRSEVVSA